MIATDNDLIKALLGDPFWLSGRGMCMSRAVFMSHFFR